MSDTEEQFESFEQIAARLDAEEKGIATPPADNEPEVEPKPAEPKEEPAKPEEPEAPAEEEPDDKPAEPAARNPEPSLPLSRHKAILEEARAARDKAEQERQALIDEIAKLRKESTPKSTKLEKLRESMPSDLLEVLEEYEEKIAKQEEILSAHNARIEAEQRSMNERLQAEVTAAFEGNAELKSWQSGNEEAWALAKQYDDQLQHSPRWKGKPIADRFAAVTRLVRADLDLPAPTAPAPAAPAQRQAASKPRPLPKETAPVPGSLTDLPGGATPTPQTQNQLLSAGDPIALAAMSSRMTERQLEEFLARAG